MVRKKTDTEFKQEVVDLVGNEYVFLDSYVNARTKLRVKHVNCGNIYKVTPISFLKGTRCPYCAILSERKTDAQFKKEVYNLVSDEYVFLDKYVNKHTKIKVKHNECGNIYEVKPNDFLSGHRCPYCNGNIKKTNDQFKKEVFDLVGDSYTFLDPYINNRTKLRVKHNKCGNIYKVDPNKFLSGRRCPYCRSNANKTNTRFKQEVYDLVGNEYIFLDKYVNSDTKLRVKHIKCGNTYEVRPTDFFSHHARCPYCGSPKGEILLTKILNTINIKYDYQKIFDDLKDDRLLSYDFFIPSQKILIEYQGLQHYQPIDYFGGDTTFKRQQKHDKMKADYAKDHGYKLIAVPYTEDTFSKIKKYLSKHGLKLY